MIIKQWERIGVSNWTQGQAHYEYKQWKLDNYPKYFFIWKKKNWTYVVEDKDWEVKYFDYISNIEV